jgi:hypothetical protein
MERPNLANGGYLGGADGSHDSYSFRVNVAVDVAIITTIGGFVKHISHEF